MLNWADYCIIATLGLSVLMGLWRGFIGEVLALACWIAAFWVAWMFGDKLAASFTAVTVPSARLMLGYGVCFIAVLIAGAIVSFLMRKLIAGSGLSGSDRMFGMLFGLLRGLVLVTLAVLILQFTPFSRDPWWRQSQLLPTFENGARWLSAQLPEEAKKYLDWHQVVPQIPNPAGNKATPAPPADTSKKSSTT